MKFAILPIITPNPNWDRMKRVTNFIEIEEALLNYKNDNLDIRHGS